MKKTTVDFTRGNIVKLLVAFIIPILLSQVLQNLYNSFDSYIVGNYVSTIALAAVSASSDISNLLVNFFSGLSTGSGVLFARYFGNKSYDKLHDSIHTAVTFALIMGVSMAALGILFAPALLRLVDCPDDVFSPALLYLRVYLIGVLFTAIYNVGAGILRAVGDSKSPLQILFASAATNIILDYVFVVFMKMEVLGVGLATVISQFVSVAMVAYKLISTNDVHKLVISDLGIKGETLQEVITLGLPTAVQSCLTGFSNLFVSRYINGFGSDAIAGIGAAKKIDKFVSLTCNSTGQAITTFVSQNHGAGNLDRTVEGIKKAFVINIVMLVAASIPVLSFPAFFVSIFNKKPEAVAYGAQMVRTIVPFYCFMMCNQIFSGSTRGFGKSRSVMFLSLMGMIGMRQLFLAVSMKIDHNVRNIFIGYPVGWFFSAFFVFIYFYFVIYRKEIKGKI